MAPGIKGNYFYLKQLKHSPLISDSLSDRTDRKYFSADKLQQQALPVPYLKLCLCFPPSLFASPSLAFYVQLLNFLVLCMMYEYLKYIFLK